MQLEDKLQMDDPHLQRVLEEGVAPEELSFQFECQRCGVVCCTYEKLDYVWFSPYTYAYIQTLLSPKKLARLFEAKILIWEYWESFHIHRLRPGADLCPFLLIHWNVELQAKFLRVIDHPEIRKSSLLSPYTQTVAQKLPLNPNKTLYLPVHDILERLTYTYFELRQLSPSLFPLAEANSVISGFYALLAKPEFRDGQPPPASPIFPTSCQIYAYRPNMCRTFPLERSRHLIFSQQKTTFSQEQAKEQVRLTTHICPERAFTQGPPRTGRSYLQTQEVDQMELEGFMEILNFYLLYTDSLRALTDRQKQDVQEELKKALYSPLFHPEPSIYSQTLQATLRKCMEGITRQYNLTTAM